MNADHMRIDSHKLQFHPERVSEWMKGEDIAPIYIEVSPTGACNHRCKFCGRDFLGYKPDFMPVDIFLQRLKEMGFAGVKSIMFAGDGEPLLHKDLPLLVSGGKKSGIDVSITTNGVMLNSDLCQKILPSTTWIKISCNAGSANTYAYVHGTSSDDFKKVLNNLKSAVHIRNKLQIQCTIGVQAVLLPENLNEIASLAKLSQDSGADYIVIKPYSHNPQSLTRTYKSINYERLEDLEDNLLRLRTSEFKVIYRKEAIERWDRRCKSYTTCHGLPFWAYIDSNGDLWGCSMHIGNEHFYYGNILQNSFNEVWHGLVRKQGLEWCRHNLDASQCRVNCRMEAINIYLEELTHPHPHVNFI